MRKLVLWVAATVVMLCFAATAGATTYTFIPSPSANLWDLDHTEAYAWGIDWNHQDEVITGVSISITDIFDWEYENNDSLYVTLLDNPQSGVHTYFDDDAFGNLFENSGTWLTTWHDPFGDEAHKTSLSYSLGDLGLLDEFQNYAQDGYVGFGFDPDCHYYNGGISVTVDTETVPEPATFSLMGLGLLGGGIFRRCKKRK